MSLAPLSFSLDQMVIQGPCGPLVPIMKKNAFYDNDDHDNHQHHHHHLYILEQEIAI